ncbi:thiamine pyrophosphate-dependent dehydrogenase E1 component subunit alpha [Arthrobacter sp. AK01]|uniref:thiamine pyrophosphate-dependent dehydrogenase E1 component subunit alpha n=1 Tax=Micrococcaceae TaxID=1268 RepID=UPI001E4D4E4B|nr:MULTISPECIES: thiamine pyrophosphate-dependent dehydrogenase E1 component subunit alpha [Micrococcaceae]MCD4853426.1 thiamine pyrophosphate-dependent dehydrogenase E1 component subunit alpha [Arthrobacter sp. AK01]MCP1413770.1 pyruvate dehydrogenase E1 component alpha subunit [Paenarthrobacter sp. A20]
MTNSLTQTATRAVGIDLEEGMDLLRRMILIRRFEERAAQLRASGLIPGFLHPCSGQEAVAVGVCAALGENDVLTSTHRGHGHLIGRGADPARMYAELFARSTGYNAGKGGSLHMIDAELGFLGANGIVGGGIPLATGAALQLKRTGSGAVAVTFFGDGASNEGAFHESLNLAALWKLPVLFVCENNLYGEFTRQNEHMLLENVADRASAYGLPGVVVDGNDVLAVRQVAAEAADRARNGMGPTLIEAKTYRHKGHFEGDMARYRPKEEVESWMKRDPLVLFPNVLRDELGATEESLEALRQEVEERLSRDIEWAKEQEHPSPEDALQHVYVDSYNGRALR